MTLRLQALHDIPLLLRQHLSLEAVKSQLSCYRFGGYTTIAGDHHHSNAIPPQHSHGFGGRALDRIGHAQETRGAAVDRHE